MSCPWESLAATATASEGSLGVLFGRLFLRLLRRGFALRALIPFELRLWRRLLTFALPLLALLEGVDDEFEIEELEESEL
jgi:hypothetical protein